MLFRSPFAEEYGRRILGKTGGTPYYLNTLTAEVGEGLTVPSSSLAAMKRAALEQLDSLRRAPKAIPFTGQCGVSPKREFRNDTAPALRVIFHSAEQVPLHLWGVEMAYLPIDTEAELLEYAAKKLLRRGAIPAVEVPRGIFGREADIVRWAEAVKWIGINDIMIHNVGLIPVLRPLGMRIHGGFGLNVFNGRALDEFAALGLTDNELSMELTLHQIAALDSRQPRGAVIRGRIPMMLTRNCPAVLSPKGCTGAAKEGGTCGLIDRTGRELPVMCRVGCAEIFNPVMMSVTENVAGKPQSELSLDWVTLSFTDESAETCGEIIANYTANTLGREPNITAGLYFKGVL